MQAASGNFSRFVNSTETSQIAINQYKTVLNGDSNIVGSPLENSNNRIDEISTGTD